MFRNISQNILILNIASEDKNHKLQKNKLN